MNVGKLLETVNSLVPLEYAFNDDFVGLTVGSEDSKVSGEDEKQPELSDLFETPGFGLRSTAERLENLYGDGFSFNASTSRLGGLKLALHLPTRGKQK